MNGIKALYLMVGNYVIQSDNDILALCSLLYRNYLCVDRFGYMNKFSKWKLDKSDDFSIISNPISLSFKEIFDNKIAEIVDRSNKENKNIYVSWSGGVDSSAIVCKLLEYDIRDNLKILYNDNSIEEFPELYNILSKNNVETINITRDNGENYKNIADNNLLVTGWCADQLFGSSVCNDYPSYNDTYKNWIYQYYKNYSDAIEQSEETLKYYDIPVKTFVQWCWFTNFFTKYNFIRLTPYAVIGKYSDNIINFYDTIDFQKWCLNNFEKITFESQYDNIEYKKELKNIIYDYTKNDDYLLKEKKNSWVTYNSTLLYLKAVLITNEYTDFYRKDFYTDIDLNRYVRKIARVFKND